MLDLLLLRAWHIKKELRQIAKKMPDEAMVLDAGAGFGQYTYYLSKLGKKWKVTAIDLKAEQVADCNLFFDKIGKSQRVKFETADLTTFCYPNKYDLAIAIDVLEHISDDAAVFKNMYKSLKSGGILLISTPSDDKKNRHDAFIDEHEREGYNPKELENKILEAGFAKIFIQYTYGKPGRISWLISMKMPMKMLELSKIFFIFLPIYYLITFPFCIILNFWDLCATHEEGTGLKAIAEK